MTKLISIPLVAALLFPAAGWLHGPSVIAQETGEINVVFFVCEGGGISGLDVVSSAKEASQPPDECGARFSAPGVSFEFVDATSGRPVAEIVADPESGIATGDLPPGTHSILGFEPQTIDVAAGESTFVQPLVFPESLQAADSAPLCADSLGTPMPGSAEPVVSGGPLLRWSVPLPPNAFRVGQIGFDSDSVVLGMSAQETSAIASFDSGSGALRWCKEFDQLLSGSQEFYPGGVVAAHGVVVASLGPAGWEGEAETIGLDLATGEELWRVDGALTAFSERSTTEAVVVGIFDDAEGLSIAALALASGQELWRFEPESSLQPGNPIAGDGTVFVPSDLGGETIVALDIETGQEQPQAELDIEGSIDSITYSEGTLFVATLTLESESMNSRVYALEGETGAEIWQSSDTVGAGTEHIVADGRVYVIHTPDLLALELTSGSPLWTFALVDHWDNTFEMAPVVFDGQVIGSEPTGSGSDGEALTTDLIGIDSESGSEVWRLPLDGIGNFPSPLVADGALFVVGTELMALERR